MNILSDTRKNVRNLSYCTVLLCCAVLSHAQEAPTPYGALPSERQLRWQETEMYCIMHFGLATYTNKEWGYGNEDPALFTAPNFNADRVIGTIKEGGFKGIVVVAKHHDGFCLWPTATTDYSIKQSPWKDGKGDMVKEYQKACEKAGIKMGIYCSPWDRNSLLYGEPSYVTDIYTKQLKELYANYGNLFMSWHDGANGGDGYYGGADERREIDRTTYYDWPNLWEITRSMQPGACIFGDAGPDVRWVGNEEGFAAETSWATFTPQAREEGKLPANGFVKYEFSPEGTRNGEYWIPAECDVPLRPGWFYHASQDNMVKTPLELLELYYKSVGRGACLDLGINLNPEGELPSQDVIILKEFGALLKEIFSVNLADGATPVASNTRGGNIDKFGPGFVLDDDRYSYWATDDTITNPKLILELKGEKKFNLIRIRENIRLGQRIEKVAVDIWEKNDWKEVATATSIGANRLVKLDEEVITSKVRLRILESPVCIALSDFSLFLEPARIKAPIVKRDRDGYISIRTADGQPGEIRYTTDFSTPTSESNLYTGPFLLTDAGFLKALQMSAENTYSEITFEQFDRSKKGWQVIRTHPDSGNPDDAIDENPDTFWSTLDKKMAFPQEIIMDTGEQSNVQGFTYLPRQDKQKEGMIYKYEVQTSIDGEQWETRHTGEFSNIQANPIKQWIFTGNIEVRFIKFIAHEVVAGEGITIAEIGCF